MASVINATQCRKDLFSVLDAAVVSGERFTVTTKNGNAVIIGEDDFNSILETLYLLSDPALMNDIDEAERTHDEARDWRECLKDIS